jgi:hypothetical protein
MGLNPTGRLCDDASCKGPLRDRTYDWCVRRASRILVPASAKFTVAVSHRDTDLPQSEFEPAEKHHRQADLAIVMVRE